MGDDAAAGGGAFLVAEVKPHFGCSSGEGPRRVRKYIQQLVGARYGIITMLQVEFGVDLPRGYVPIGAACGRSILDSAVAFIRDDLFRVVRPLGDTLVGRGSYAGMPWLATGAPGAEGNMCVADPRGTTGVRAYAGAELEHRGSGQHFCLVVGTFPHPESQSVPYGLAFLEQVAACSREQPLLVVADTNLADEDLDALPHGFDWSGCSDPARQAAPTCCNDSAWGHPEPRYRSDRTFLCGGGSVTDFQVEPSFVCRASEEHRFTTAKVLLPAVAAIDDLGESPGRGVLVCAVAAAAAVCYLGLSWRRMRSRPAAAAAAAAREPLLDIDGC